MWITQSHGRERDAAPKVYGSKKKLQTISDSETWYLTGPGILFYTAVPTITCTAGDMPLLLVNHYGTGQITDY